MKLFATLLPSAALCLCLCFATGVQAADKDMKSMMEEGHQKMMSMPMSGKPDVDFAMMMREHHKGALTMAEWELEHGKDAKMKDMARKIVAAQKKEIAQFDRFLAQNGHQPGSGGMGASGSGSHGHSK